MTSLTSSEIKLIYFGLIFVGVVAAFVGLYSSNPIQEHTYQGESNAENATSSSSSLWISGLIGTLPSPFNDANLVIIVSIFITPVVIILGYVAVRALKDLISQWI